MHLSSFKANVVVKDLTAMVTVNDDNHMGLDKKMPRFAWMV